MSYKTALQAIEKGAGLPCYICYGAERYLLQQFIDSVIRLTVDPAYAEFAVTRYDLAETPLDTVLDDAGTLPFMSERKVIVAANAAFFTGAKESGKVEHRTERLVAYLKSPSPETVIVFIAAADKLDERKKLVKAFKDAGGALAFAPLQADELQRWAIRQAQRRKAELSEASAVQLVMYAGTDLAVLAQEIEKLSLFAGTGGTITAEAIERLVVPTTEQNVFILIDDIVRRNMNRAFAILNELLKQREEPIKLVALMARQFRMIMQTKELEKQGHSQQHIAGQIGAHPYAVKIASEQGRSYTAGRLGDIIRMLADLDYGMKSGRTDKTLGLEMTMLRLMNGK
ncbi:DNA polymerase III subunit delta [Paenibacillus cymbidii]|uniref:DNA polymerase III subunit delta n=1 Tax=Paenibacillus cymbidii TaxID=1639034 RepID=UPI0010821099|nr:DNA polymerase III subunit delta [Paenibacillus cymbidii]